MSTVLDELGERKDREKDIIMYGLKENNSESKDARNEHDIMSGRSTSPTSLQLLQIINQWTQLIDKGVSADCIHGLS